MLLTSTAGLGRACMVPPGLLSLHSTPRAPAAARVWAQAARASTHCHRRSAVCPTASKEEGVAAVGSDLNWGHVAWDVKCRLAAVVEKKQSFLDHLQNWLNETRLSCNLEGSQAEMVAEQEAEYQGLSGMQLDVKQWLTGASDEETNSKMAGVLTLRVLQAYHKEAGEGFDDEDEDAFWRLQGLLPGTLVEALDHDTLTRMIKSYIALPFSGV